MTEQNQESEVILTTPVGKVYGTPFLLFQDHETARKFPRMGKNGKNKNLHYKIALVFDPSKNTDHEEFIKKIKELEKEVLEKAGSEQATLLSTMRPAGVKNTQTGEWSDSPTDVVLQFKSVDQIKTTEKGEELFADKLMLDKGSKATVEVSVRPYDFIDEAGNRKVGIKLQPLQVNIVARAEKRNTFIAKKKG